MNYTMAGGAVFGLDTPGCWMDIQAMTLLHAEHDIIALTNIALFSQLFTTHRFASNSMARELGRKERLALGICIEVDG